MKKLAILLTVFIVAIIVAGCVNRNGSSDENPSNSGDVTTTVTPIEEGEDGSMMIDLAETATLEITSFEGKKLETHTPYHVIRGTTPVSTFSITVNDYILGKYSPGQTQWSYIAATNFGTLKEGDNKYTVRSLDKEGNEIDSVSFKIDYTPAIAPELPDTGNSLWLMVLLGWMGTFAYGTTKLKRA